MAPSQFQCNICGKRFTRKENLRGHLRSHNSEKVLDCSRCNKTFSHASELSRHQNSHSGQKKYTCEGFGEGGTYWGCGKQFTRLEGLKNHLSKSKAGQLCEMQRINAQTGSLVESSNALTQVSSISSILPNQWEANILLPSATFMSDETDLPGDLSIPGIQQQSPAVSEPKDPTMENATLTSQQTTLSTSMSSDSFNQINETMDTPTRLTTLPWGIICDGCKKPCASTHNLARTQYHCNFCKISGYEFCESCFDKGFRCLDKKHLLVKLGKIDGHASLNTTGGSQANISIKFGEPSSIPRIPALGTANVASFNTQERDYSTFQDIAESDLPVWSKKKTANIRTESTVASSSSTAPQEVPLNLDIARKTVKMSVPKKLRLLHMKTSPPGRQSKHQVFTHIHLRDGPQSYIKKAKCEQCRRSKMKVSQS
jgi:hypothetical protein